MNALTANVARCRVPRIENPLRVVAVLIAAFSMLCGRVASAQPAPDPLFDLIPILAGVLERSRVPQAQIDEITTNLENAVQANQELQDSLSNVQAQLVQALCTPDEVLDGSGSCVGKRDLNAMSNDNTAAGQGALVSLDIGRDNTAFGRLALSSTSSGSDNTAVGSNALADNTTGYRNSALGAQALASNSTGSDNVGIGAGALEVNTTGSDNVAVGQNALKSNTTGYSNVAVGDRTLETNSTGGQNVAVGLQSLRQNSSGTGNTAVGFLTMPQNTTGGGNSAFGADALQSNTTGQGNVAVGVEALRHNTTAHFNTAVGDRALWQNTEGFSNSALGVNALQDNTTGSENTALGSGALYGNTTGTNNTAVGKSAMSLVLQGSENTAIGWRALAGNLNESGDDNTAVGVKALEYANGNRNIALGKQAGSNLVTGDDNIYLGSLGGAETESDVIRVGEGQTAVYVAGIHGRTTGGDGIGVIVDSEGNLGTVVSSRRFKEDVRDIADGSARLMQLRPVAFHYRSEDPAAQRAVEFGLISEEVAEVFPELVVRDADGRPLTVKYRLLSTLLLDRVQVQQEELEQLRAVVRSMAARVSSIESRTSTPEAHE